MPVRRDFTRDYEGPPCNWPGQYADREPDWANLFPLPPSKASRSQQQQARAAAGADQQQQQTAAGRQQAPYDEYEEDSSEYSEDFEDDWGFDDDDEGTWLTPRTAAALYFAGKLMLRDWTEEARYTEPVDLNLPEIVSPYRWLPSWRLAYVDCIKRVMSRLAKGRHPHPNCTGEEMVLHTLIQHAQNFDIDFFQEWYPRLMAVLDPLPESRKDLKWNLVQEVAFDDHDVLMLHDQPGLINYSAVHAQLDMGNLHPEEWFLPFQPRWDHML